MSHSSSTALVGGKDDDRNHESDQGDNKETSESEMPTTLEEGELEEGELDEDDDLGVDGKDKAEETFQSASDSRIQLSSSGASVNDNSGKPLSVTDVTQPKKTKEIPSLFDLKTTKPKSIKRSAEEKGKKSFPQYIDHDRIDDEYYDEEGDMAASMWPGYPMPGDDYEGSDCDQEVEDEFSVEIQQMLNRSATGSHNVFEGSERSPRGPYDSPSEEEGDENDDECPPPAKMARIDDEDDNNDIGYGSLTKLNRKSLKKMMTSNGRLTNSDGDGFQKKSKLQTNRGRKRGESDLSQNNNALLEMQATEKRRLADTPMDERPQCKFFLEGKCKKGANCPFNHDIKRSNKSGVCKYFLSGQCGKGKDCVFSHVLKGISEEDNDCKTDNLMPKKRKALLGSPPLMQSRLMQAKDKKKIPSLFDIQINAEGPNAKEILQSAARRSVMMQSTNPKPGLLGVAPPMIAAGMMGTMNRMRFPMNQGFFDNFSQPPPQQKMDEGGQEMLHQGLHNITSDFVSCRVEENEHSQQINCLNTETELFPEQNEGQAVEEIAQNAAFEFGGAPVLSGSIAGTLNSQQPPFAIQTNIQLESQSAASLPISSTDLSAMPQSCNLPSSNLPFLSQLTCGSSFSSDLHLPSLTDEALNLPMNVSSPLTKVEEEEKPHIVGGVDINHLPPKQREIYLRMFVQQKEINAVSSDPQFSDKANVFSGEENVEIEGTIPSVGNTGNINSSADLLKFLIPSQVASQSLIPEAVASNQPSSSSSSFTINHMLSVICGGGAGASNSKQFQMAFGGAGPASAESPKPPDVAFEVSGSSLRGLYRLEPVTLETNAITLPPSIDPKDPKFSSDPRVLKHKDDVVVPSHKDGDKAVTVVVPGEPSVRVQTSVQRRDPRLARKENVAAKEEVQQPPSQAIQQQQQQQQPLPLGGMPLQSTAIGSIMQQTGMQLGNMLQGGMSLGNMPQRGMPVGSMQAGGMPLGCMQNNNGMTMGSMQQGGMSIGSMQQSGMLMGSMQQSGMPMGNMQQSGMPMGSMGGTQQGNINLGGMKLNTMPLGGIQQGGMGILMGGMQQQGSRPMSGLPLSGMLQGGVPMGGMQQGGLLGSGMQQGGPPMGGMQMGGFRQNAQGGMATGSLQQGGMPMGAMSAGAIQQRINLSTGGSSMQQGGLLPQPPGGLLQRGMMPPFILPNQIPAMNSFQRATNNQLPPTSMINGQLPFGLCRPVMSHNDSSNINPAGPAEGAGAGMLQSRAPVQTSSIFQPGSSTCNGSVMPQIGSSFMRPLLPNPAFPRPLLPMPVQANVPMSANLSQSSAGSSSQPPFLPSEQSSPGDLNHQNESVPAEAQPQHHSSEQQSCEGEPPVGNDSSDVLLSDLTSSSEALDVAGNSTGKAERALNYREDYRFRIKKARLKDDTTENSAVEKKDSDNFQKPDATHITSESDAETRRAFIRNRDKLEFRSPLADMGDSSASSLSFGYNQPPNKKYQQMAEEENNLRRSASSKAGNKDNFKPKQRVAPQLPAAGTQSEAPVSAFATLRPSLDAVSNDGTPSVQSIKDMFKSIDPTASPFC